jgi:hypothetical protein
LLQFVHILAGLLQLFLDRGATDSGFLQQQSLAFELVAHFVDPLLLFVALAFQLALTMIEFADRLLRLLEFLLVLIALLQQFLQCRFEFDDRVIGPVDRAVELFDASGKLLALLPDAVDVRQRGALFALSCACCRVSRLSASCCCSWVFCCNRPLSSSDICAI